jgi:predicted DNA-binding ribbon-helix-helix protein
MSALLQTRKRSMRIGGKFTSVKLEMAFWEALECVARQRQLPLNAMVTEIEQARAEEAPAASLASAIRVYTLEHAPRTSPTFAAQF